MKKGLLLVVTLLAVFTLSACKAKSTMTCIVGSDEYEYVYDDENLIKYSYMGVEIEDGVVIEGITMDYDAFVSIAGGIESYIENTKLAMESMGGTCTIEE